MYGLSAKKSGRYWRFEWTTSLYCAKTSMKVLHVLESTCRTISWNNRIPSTNKPTRQKNNKLWHSPLLAYHSHIFLLMCLFNDERKSNRALRRLSWQYNPYFTRSFEGSHPHNVWCWISSTLHLSIILWADQLFLNFFFSPWPHDCQYSSFGEFLRNETVHKTL